MLISVNKREVVIMQVGYSIREELHHLADELPDNATWKDVAYEAYVRQEIKAGLAQARRGEFADDNDVKNTFAKWGVQVES